jgi:UDP-N-acetylglucosamine:LPS N-acetylglucosamine transferase
MANARRNVRVCLAASAGGHACELVKLERSWAGLDCFFVTTSSVVERQLARFGRVYVVNESNRKQPLRLLKALVSCLRIVAAQRPDVVISTGASVGCLMAIFGRLQGAKVVWVDSIANAERLSLSGRIVRPFANLILTQWPDIAKRYKFVEYAGQII